MEMDTSDSKTTGSIFTGYLSTTCQIAPTLPQCPLISQKYDSDLSWNWLGQKETCHPFYGVGLEA